MDSKKMNDCWIWMGYITPNGQGMIGRHTIASRFVYESAYGEIPKGLEVCHSCDNPSCVNPAHLWVGTHRENVHDSIDKGRARIGMRGICNNTGELAWSDKRNICQTCKRRGECPPKECQEPRHREYYLRNLEQKKQRWRSK